MDGNRFGVGSEGWGNVPGYLPPGPHNLPRGAAARWATGGAGFPPGIDVREVNRYPLCTTVSVPTTTIDASTRIITQPDTTRILLIVRCANTSPGAILVSFGIDASDATAAFRVAAGGVLLLDYVVPQDDVYLLAETAGAFGVVVYANSPL